MLVFPSLKYRFARLPSRFNVPANSSIVSAVAYKHDPETRLSEYWERYKETRGKYVLFALAHPVATARALRDGMRLPRLEAHLSNSPQARFIGGVLQRKTLHRTFSLAAVGLSILPVPAKPEEYSAGSSRQTLRRKSRAATAAGVTWRAIDDLDEQRQLVTLLEEALKTKADVRYRQPNSDYHALVGLGMWTVAFSGNGEPIIIAVTPYDGRWAILTAFQTLGHSKQHSDARYYLTQIVVERLSERGVRYLADTRSPAELENGLRHFQRMLGFRIARVRIITDTGSPEEARGKAAPESAV